MTHFLLRCREQLERISLFFVSLVFVCQKVRKLQLLLSGDIEKNPGPMTKEQGKELESVVSTIQGLEKGQAEVLATLKQWQKDLKKSDAAVVSLTALETHPTIVTDRRNSCI